MSLMEAAAKMVSLADELDPPPPPMDHSVRSVCGTCGTEYRGREYATGQSCESCDEAGRMGFLKRVKPCTCEPEEDMDIYIRSFGDEMLTAVEVDDLAFQAAFHDLLTGGPDHVEPLGMASTYRGRRA